MGIGGNTPKEFLDYHQREWWNNLSPRMKEWVKNYVPKEKPKKKYKRKFNRKGINE